MILAHLLTDHGGEDGAIGPALIDQVEVPIERLTGVGAYDRRSIYKALEKAGSSDIQVVISPRSGAVDSGEKEGLWPQRDAAVHRIAAFGRRRWERESGYCTVRVPPILVLVFVNTPGVLDELKVRLVELYAAVLNPSRRPMTDLAREDFTVHEDGVQQEVLRFEQIRDLPIHASIVFDSSSSMEASLDKARNAALSFFEQIITPKDRAAVVNFSNRPNLVVKFTNSIDALAAEMAGVRAEGSTALWDAVIFTLQYMNGLKGQRTILLLTDGQDEGSRFTFKEATTYAQAAGVTFYTIGLGLGKSSLETRHRLTKLADITGGRGYFIKDISELDRIYREIQQELRAKYLLTYQSTNNADGDTFRKVEVTVGRRGVEVRTMPGYYP